MVITLRVNWENVKRCPPSIGTFSFRGHLIAKNVIEGYEIFVMRYDAASSVMVLFIISFRNHEILAKLARSLLDKFFVLTMDKILGGKYFSRGSISLDQ